MRNLAIIVIAVGVLGILISLPLLGLAILAHLGVLADVSLAENREMADQWFSLGLLPLIGGVVLCALGALGIARTRRTR